MELKLLDIAVKKKTRISFADIDITMRQLNDSDYLIYRLIYSEGALGNEKSIYSVLISYCQNGTPIDEKFIFDISRNNKEARQIYELLESNLVTPSSSLEAMDSIFDIIANSL